MELDLARSSGLALLDRMQSLLLPDMRKVRTINRGACGILFFFLHICRHFSFFTCSGCCLCRVSRYSVSWIIGYCKDLPVSGLLWRPGTTLLGHGIISHKSYCFWLWPKVFVDTPLI